MSLTESRPSEGLRVAFRMLVVLILTVELNHSSANLTVSQTLRQFKKNSSSVA